MSDRTDTGHSATRAEAAGAPHDQDLEEVLEDTLDEASVEEAGEVEEVVEAVLVEEEEEEEDNQTVEGAIEPELELEDETAINEDVVLDRLLRRSGVLPQRTDTGALDEATELPAVRGEGEFLCSTCFLIKPNSQMGDAARGVCRDCVDPPDGPGRPGARRGTFGPTHRPGGSPHSNDRPTSG